MKKINLVLILVFAIGISSSLFAGKTKSVGVVNDVSGTVVIQRGTKNIPVSLNTKIMKSDIIKTVSSASVTLKFTNGRIVSLNQNRRVKIADLMRPQIKKKWLKSLKFHRITKNAGNKKEMMGHTAVVGVRGDEKSYKNKLSQEYIWIDNGLPDDTEKKSETKK